MIINGLQMNLIFRDLILFIMFVYRVLFWIMWIKYHLKIKFLN